VTKRGVFILLLNVAPKEGVRKIKLFHNTQYLNFWFSVLAESAAERQHASQLQYMTED